MTDKRTDLLVEIVSQEKLKPEEQLDNALKKTASLLGMDFGFIGRVIGTNYHIENIYTGKSAFTFENPLKLSETFCQYTLKMNGMFAIHDIARSEHSDSPAHTKFNFNSYIGIPFSLDGKVLGTVNFTGMDARAPFTKEDHNLMVILGSWVGNIVHRIYTEKKIEEDQKKYTRKIEQQLEQLQQLKETREKLYSIIAHDIRNSIFGIAGLMDLISDDLKNKAFDLDSLIYKVDLIHHSTKQTYKLLENLLTWVKVQSGEFDINPVPFDITIQIDSTVELLNPAINTKNIHINKNYHHGMRVFGETKAINTIIRNLINNAVKFSKPDSEIDITVDQTSEPDMTLISVRDHGIGMNKQTLSNLFNPSNRPKKKGTLKETGSGLGLILSKELAHLSHGDITVKSTPQSGSEFTLYIPTYSA
ncbi:MAG TPA: hypothetical protein DEQ34_02900 [Balneolaceae bacterium]|nr:hypothetical protein [Balneolaceae bacterium]